MRSKRSVSCRDSRLDQRAGAARTHEDDFMKPADAPSTDVIFAAGRVRNQEPMSVRVSTSHVSANGDPKGSGRLRRTTSAETSVSTPAARALIADTR